MVAGRTPAPPIGKPPPPRRRRTRCWPITSPTTRIPELFGVTELCNAFDVTPRTLRFYEDKGLLSPRRINGTRVYSRRDRARLALILRAKVIGSSLAEIKQYLDMYGQAAKAASSSCAMCWPAPMAPLPSWSRSWPTSKAAWPSCASSTAMCANLGLPLQDQG